jgi:hypothetical protein
VKKYISVAAELTYMGHIFIREKVKPNLIKAVQNYPVSYNVKEVGTFLDLAFFYRCMKLR